MADKADNNVTPPVDPAVGEPAEKPRTKIDDPAILRLELDRVRDEAKEARRKLKALEESQLEKDKKWEDLATNRQKEIDDLRPKADQVDTLAKALKGTVEKRIAGLPEQYRSLVPEYTDPTLVLTWLDANESKLKVPRAGALDAGAGGATAAPISLTEGELYVAAKMGLSVEEYTKYKNPK